jgi:hypothetical protein
MGSSSWLCSSTLWPDSSATHGQVPRVAAPRGRATSRRAVRRARRSSRPPGLFVDRRQCVARLAEATAKAASRRVHPPSSTPRGPPAQLARHSSATPALRHEEQDAVAGRCGRVHGLRETSTISTPGPSPRRVHRMILTGSREYWSGTRTSPSVPEGRSCRHFDGSERRSRRPPPRRSYGCASSCVLATDAQPSPKYPTDPPSGTLVGRRPGCSLARAGSDRRGAGRGGSPSGSGRPVGREQDPDDAASPTARPDLAAAADR